MLGIGRCYEEGGTSNGGYVYRNKLSDAKAFSFQKGDLYSSTLVSQSVAETPGFLLPDHSLQLVLDCESLLRLLVQHVSPSQNFIFRDQDVSQASNGLLTTLNS